MDALGEVTDTTIGVEGRSKVEARIRQLEGGSRLKETSKSSAAMSQVRTLLKMMHSQQLGVLLVI